MTGEDTPPLQNVKRIVAVHSGKGGVGKTFLTVNLAYLLAEQGKSVGILDADIDCPNVPAFLKMTARMHIDKAKRFVPVNHHGIKVVSTGLTREDDGTPFLIRGPAKHQLVMDLLQKTDWGHLDYLLIDLPPGTADVPLSILEFGGVDGVLHVTSPDRMALIDTKKSIMMTRQIDVKQLGVIENLSGEVFGTDTARALAEELEIPYLGTVPLSQEISAFNARGEPILTAAAYETVGQSILRAL